MARNSIVPIRQAIAENFIFSLSVQCTVKITAYNHIVGCGCVQHHQAFVIACSILLSSIVLRYCSVCQMPNDASVLAFCWQRNPLFWHFKSNKRTKTKRKNGNLDFLKSLHVFYSVFSIRCKICNICRSLTLWQKVSVLMTAVFER